MTRIVTVEENKPAQRPVPGASKAGTGEAARFAGQPVVQWFKLQRCMEELLRYRASGKHSTERESSVVKLHSQWKADAMELCLALRDGLSQGLLEPQKPQRDDD